MKKITHLKLHHKNTSYSSTFKFNKESPDEEEEKSEKSNIAEIYKDLGSPVNHRRTFMPKGLKLHQSTKKLHIRKGTTKNL